VVRVHTNFLNALRRLSSSLSAALLAGELPPNVVIITHGSVINIIYHLLKGIEWNNQRPSYPTTPTSIHEVSYRQGFLQLTVENNVRHLQTV
jgi:probable phosphoglycerate mutase